MSENFIPHANCTNVIDIIKGAETFSLPNGIAAFAIVWLVDKGYVLISSGKGKIKTYSEKGDVLPIQHYSLLTFSLGPNYDHLDQQILSDLGVNGKHFKVSPAHNLLGAVPISHLRLHYDR